MHRLTWELFSLRKPLHSSSTRYTISTPGLYGWSSFAYAPLAVCDFRYEHISREIRISHLYGQPRMAGSHQSFFNNQENNGLVDVTSILVLERFSRKTSMRNEWPAEVVGLKPAARFILIKKFFQQILIDGLQTVPSTNFEHGQTHHNLRINFGIHHEVLHEFFIRRSVREQFFIRRGR